MSKIRVYEVAREVKLESKVLLDRLKELGIKVSSHQSTLTVAQIEKIKSSDLVIGKNKPVVVRRRKKVVSSTAAEATSSTSIVSEPSVAEEVKGTSVSLPKQEDIKSPLEVRPDGNAVVSDKVSEQVVSEKSPPVSSVLSEDTDTVNHLSKSLQNDASTSLEGKSILQRKTDGNVAKMADRLESMAPVRNLSLNDSLVKLEEQKSEWLKKNKAAEINEDKLDETKNVADSSLHKESAKDSKNKPISRGLSATIVRRATPEEVEALKLDVRNRSRSRSDNRNRYSKSVNYGASEDRFASSKGPNDSRFSKASNPKENRSAPLSRSPKLSDDRSFTKTSNREDSRYASTRAVRSGEGAQLGIKTRDMVPPMSASSSSSGSRKRKDPKVRVGDEDQASRSRIQSVDVSRRAGADSMRMILKEAELKEEGLDALKSSRKRVVYTPVKGGYSRSSKKNKRILKKTKSTEITIPRASLRIVRMESLSISVNELAKQLSVKVAAVIKTLMSQGVMATVNQEIDYDTATLIAAEYGYECKSIAKSASNIIDTMLESSSVTEKTSRAPIITVMGHVDHGKTSILDTIRKENVVSGEAGGITQHIGAYTVDYNNNKLTFLDTPGHEAFSAMRARGASITDIVVLVVAADDGVKPQTREAIAHAKNANVPVIVAINKIDKKNTNLDRIYTELSDNGLQTEEWGGDTQFVKVSAVTREGINELLDAICLQAEILELKVRASGPTIGVVVEGRLDRGKGPVTNIIVLAGQLKTGDIVVAGSTLGKVRIMSDHNGQKLDSAGPSTPVSVVGLSNVPQAGDQFNAVTDEKKAKEIVELRQRDDLLKRKSEQKGASLEQLLERVAAEELPVLSLMIKADTQGSVEAIASSLEGLKSKKVTINIIYKAVGGISDSDVTLAETSGASILGFNVRAPRAISDSSERRNVIIKYFSIIYELIDTVKDLMAGKLPMLSNEIIEGHAEVRNAINVPKIGVIAGSSVLDGKITRTSHLRLIRNEIVIYSGRVGSLRRFKEDVKEVQHGYECGIAVDGYNDIRVGDVIESYEIEEVEAPLDI